MLTKNKSDEFNYCNYVMVKEKGNKGHLFNNVIVSQRYPLVVSFSGTFLVNQILHALQIGVSSKEKRTLID